MAAEVGQFSLVLALLIAITQSTIPLYGAASNTPALMHFARSAALAQCLFVVIAFAALTYCFVTSDFSLNVFFSIASGAVHFSGSGTPGVETM